jgi:hypothetical protein
VARGAIALSALVALSPLAPGAVPLGAQAGLTHTEDAAVVPRGLARLRMLTSWTRWHEQWITDSAGVRRLVGLGDALAAESLGVSRLPLLGDAQRAIRTLSGDQAFSVNVGRVSAAASARMTITPIVAEYGLTRRLTIGVTVPIVQTRTSIAVDLNQEDTVRANVGVNPATVDANAAASNAAAATQLRAVAASLDARVDACTASPASAGCDVVNAEAATVRALAAEARAAATAIELLYGTGSAGGQPFVPLRESAAQQAIDRSIASIGTRAARYLATVPALTSRPIGARGPAGSRDLEALLTNPGFGIGFDSLRTTNRVGLGDVEVGAKLLLLDGITPRRGDTTVTGGMRSRVALGAVVRLPTGTEVAANTPFDLTTGGGGAVEATAYTDLAFGTRAALSLAGRAAIPFGTRRGQLPSSTGAVALYQPLVAATVERATIVSLDATPRLRLGRALSLDAHYGFLRSGDVRYVPVVASESSKPATPVTVAGATEHRLGIGATYSTREAYERGEQRLPLEVSWVTLRTIAGSGGLLPKLTRSQLQLRIYAPIGREAKRGKE